MPQGNNELLRQRNDYGEASEQRGAVYPHGRRNEQQQHNHQGHGQGLLGEPPTADFGHRLCGDDNPGWGSARQPREHESGGNLPHTDDAAAAAATAARQLLLLPVATATPHFGPLSDGELRSYVQQRDVLVGVEYYSAKQSLLNAEQRLLRALQFRVMVPQPHALALNAARTLRLPAGVQRLALALINDLWTYSDFSLVLLPPPQATAVQPPEDCTTSASDVGMEVTIAVLAAASRLAGWVVRIPSHASEVGVRWWQLLGVARDEVSMEGLVAEVMKACVACHEAAEVALHEVGPGAVG